jgi:hypothetical protein
VAPAAAAAITGVGRTTATAVGFIATVAEAVRRGR